MTPGETENNHEEPGGTRRNQEVGGGLCVDDANMAPSQLLHGGKALAADDASPAVTGRDSNKQTNNTN